MTPNAKWKQFFQDNYSLIVPQRRVRCVAVSPFRGALLRSLAILRWASQLFFGALLYFSRFKRKQLMGNLLDANNQGIFESSFRIFYLDWWVYRDIPKHRTDIVAVSATGDRWCDFYRDRAQTNPAAYQPLLERLAALCSHFSATVVLQVGCAGGGELYQLSQLVGPSVRLIGIDINKHSILLNQGVYQDEPIEFYHADALDSHIIQDTHPDVVFTSGTAEYFLESELEGFIETLKNARVNVVAFYEPITTKRFHYGQSPRSTRRGRMAFNHNYGLKIKKVGQVLMDELIPSERPGVSSVWCVGLLTNRICEA